MTAKTPQKKPIEKVVRLRYMDGFSCLGGQCPDTCCGWWTIQIDQSHHARLGKVMARDPDDKAAFDAAFKLAPPARRSREHVALMVLDDQGYFRFLAADKLCGLHTKHGEELLPDACAIYPRAYSQIGRRLELTGEPSCPEVARRLLTHEDSIVLDDAPVSSVGRLVPVQDMPGETGDPYWGMIDRVRGAFYRVLERRDFSTGQRLYFALFFASQVDRFLQPRDPQGLFSEEQLEREIDFLDRPDVLADLARRYQAAPAPTPLVVSLIAETLARVAKDSVPPRFFQLIARTLSTYDGHGMRLDPSDGGFVLSPEPLFTHFAERRAALWPKIGDRVELFFRNYLCHQVLHEWYAFAPSLFSYVQNIALRAAMFRFLLLSHPDCEAAADDPAKLDVIGVDVFYLLSRAMEHSKSLLDGASERLAVAMPDLQASVELLKL